MGKPWHKMSPDEKIEILWRAIDRINTVQIALASDMDGTWDALRTTRSELGKITKDVATLRSLWPKNYSRAS
jgi:hypothetical protein